MRRCNALLFVLLGCWCLVGTAWGAGNEAAPRVERATFSGVPRFEAGSGILPDIAYIRDAAGEIWFLGQRGQIPEALLAAVEAAARDEAVLTVTGEVAIAKDGTRVLDTSLPVEHASQASSAPVAADYSVTRAEIVGFPGREAGDTRAKDRFGLLDAKGRLWFLGTRESLPEVFAAALDKAIGDHARMLVAGRFLLYRDRTRALDVRSAISYADIPAPPAGETPTPPAADKTEPGPIGTSAAEIVGVPRSQPSAEPAKELFYVVDKDRVLWLLGRRERLPKGLADKVAAAAAARRPLRITGQVALFEGGMRVLDTGRPFDCREIAAPVVRPKGREKALLRMESLSALYSFPQQKTVVTLKKPTEITRLWTFHWNDGKGDAPGTIGLRDTASGELLGTWPAVGTRTMFKTVSGTDWPDKGDGPPYVYWAATAGIVVPPGTYEVVDSAPATWATNRDLGNRGLAWVYGRQ